MWERLVLRLVWGQKIAGSNPVTQTLGAFEMSHDPLENKPLEIEDQLRDLTPETRNRILDWIENDKQRTGKIIESVDSLKTSLDTLRVNIKYTVFDLEATRREKIDLQEQVAQLQRVLEDHGHYAEEEGIELSDNVEVLGDWSGDQLPESEGGLIDLPSMGDFIHSSECDHPYDTDCWCEYCEACRIRMQQYGNGAD